MAPYYAGDAITMIDENPDLAFVHPEEGVNFFIDNMCVPANAKHKEAAEMFINYMCETSCRPGQLRISSAIPPR